MEPGQDASLLSGEKTVDAIPINCKEVPVLYDCGRLPVGGFSVYRVRGTRFDAPEFAGGYPQVQPLDIGTRSVEVTIEAQEAAHYVLVLLPNDATPPTKEQVQSGKDGDGNDALHSAASGMAFPTHAVTVTAPEHNTPYDIYVVLCDEAGNLSEPATLDATTPSAAEYFVSGFPKTGTAQPAGSKTVQVQAKLDINEETEGTTTGWVHYVMVPDGADAPSVSQVLAHKDSSGNDPVDSGTAETVDDTVQSFTVFGSADLTDYDLYMVAESIGDDHLERCTEVVKPRREDPRGGFVRMSGIRQGKLPLFRTPFRWWRMGKPSLC